MTSYIGAPAPASPEWNYINTYTGAAAANIDCTPLTAYKTYKFVLKVTADAARTLQMTLNGNAGNNYVDMVITGAGVAYSGAQAYVRVGSIDANGQRVIEIVLNGYSPTEKSFSCFINYAFFSSIDITGLGGRWGDGATTQITQATFTPSAGTISGSISVWGRSDV